MADRRTRITIETERVLVVTGHPTRLWCEKCGSEVQFVPSERAGRLLGADLEQLGGQYASKLHLGQAKNGLVLICLKSLLSFFRATSG
jgi:hypothetical protein